MQSLQSQMSWHKSKIEDETKKAKKQVFASQLSRIEVNDEVEDENMERPLT
jgi:hypothetical protein